MVINSSDGSLSADRTLNIDMTNADRTLDLAGNLTLSADLITSGADSITFTTTGATNVTLPTSGTLSTNSAATPTVAGIVTSYADLVQSRAKVVSSADYTVLDTDGFDQVLVTTGASDRTMTLPTASANTGRVIEFVKMDSGAGDVIIDGESTETINGSTTTTFSGQYSYCKVICDGTEWIILTDYSTTTITLDNQLNGTGSGVMRLVRIGRRVDLSYVSNEFGISGLSSATSHESSAGLVPAQFRPETKEVTSVYSYESNHLRIRVEQDGTISTNYGGARTDTGTSMSSVSWTTA